MPTAVIPLYGPPTQRGIDPNTAIVAGKDQRIINALVTGAVNDIENSRAVYVEKRPGLETVATIDAGKNAQEICDNYGFKNLSGPLMALKAPGVSGLLYYISTTQIGTGLTTTVSTIQVDAIQARLSEEMYLIGTSKEGGWFIGETGMAGGSTFTGDTHTNTTIDNLSATTGLVVGQEISGTNIVAGTRISAINVSGNSLTTDTATTGTTATVTITRERISKVIHSAFPSSTVGPFATLDGFAFICEQNSQKIYQSSINDITTWAAQNYISANDTSGLLLGLAKIGDKIAAIKTDGIEFFYNNGNSSGSVLSRVKDSTIKTGVSVASGSAIFSGSSYRSFDWIDDIIAYVYDGVYFVEKGGVKKVSSPEIDRICSDATAVIVRLCKTEFGRFLYLCSLISGQTAPVFIYDIEKGIWNEIAIYNGGVLLISKKLSRAIIANVGGSDTGVQYKWDGVSPSFQDFSNAYTMTIQMEPKVMNNGMGFTVNGVHLLADNQASGTTTLETSGDDYTTWVTRGTFDMTQTKKEIRRGGFYKNSCAFRLTHSANTAWRGQAIVVDWTPGVT